MQDHAPSPIAPSAATHASAERRSHILDAAERCFVRTGFHRTTMQDVAAEAAMSPGNLYRYFPSKDAMVAGLAERDRAELARDFAAVGTTGNFEEDFRALGEKHFRDDSGKAVLCLEIWAEATRNQAIADLSAQFDRDVRNRLAALFDKAKELGQASPGIDTAAVALIACILANGLYVRRACSADFDAEREIGAVFSVISALLDGRIALAPAPRSPETSS